MKQGVNHRYLSIQELGYFQSSSVRTPVVLTRRPPQKRKRKANKPRKNPEKRQIKSAYIIHHAGDTGGRLAHYHHYKRQRRGEWC
eukprot:scaffold36759_cov38-Attheya_sp.AAC.2